MSQAGGRCCAAHKAVTNALGWDWGIVIQGLFLLVYDGVLACMIGRRATNDT
jgi:hypothetical protein